MGVGPSGTTQNQYPPWLEQYMPKLAGEATGMMFGGGKPVAPSPAPFGQVAPLSNMQTSGYGAIQDMGSFSPLIGGAMGEQAATIGGAYLDPSSNPYLSAYYNQAAENLTSQYETATQPDLLASAVESGNVGATGPAMEEWSNQFGLGQNLSNLAANIYEPAYQAERGYQQGAAENSPSLVQGSYIPAQMQISAGGDIQQQLQNVINTTQQNLSGQGMWPYQLTSGTIGAVGGTGNLGSPFGSSTTTNPGMTGLMGK